MDLAQKFLSKELNTILINKLHSVLVYDGLKPSMIFIYPKENLNFKFKKLGICGLMKYYKHKNHRSPMCYIAKNNIYLEKVIKATENVFFTLDKKGNRLDNPDFYDWSYELGSVLGYSESTILAYLNQFLDEDTKELIPSHYLSSLTTFSDRKERQIIKMLMPGTVSKENYENERLTALKWEKHIIKNYPSLYFEYFKTYLKFDFKRLFLRI